MVQIPPVELTIAPIQATVPLIDLPMVTLPRVDVPPVSLPPLDLPAVMLPPTVIPSDVAVADRPARAAQPAATLGGTASPVPAEETNGTLRDILAGGVTLISAHPTSPALSVQVRAMSSIGPPAVALLNDLGKRVRAMNLPDSASPTATALVLAVAIGVAATGTAGSGSAGGSGLAVLAAALRLPAIGGSRRLTGRLRVAAFGRPRQPGFSPG